MNKIVIPLNDEINLIAEQNPDSEFNKEIFIGIERANGLYLQDLAIIRPTYTFSGDHVLFDSDKFEVLLYADETKEDFTDKFVIPLYKESDE